MSDHAADPSISGASSSTGNRSIAILGGTGAQGRGLARRFARAGHQVLIGSRDGERAAKAAAEVVAAEPEGLSLGTITGHTNAEAAAADLVVVAVPYVGHAELLASLAGKLAGKIVVDCVVPMGFDKQGPYVLAVDAGSAAQEAQAALPDSTVVAAFHNVSAALLDDPAVASVDLDVLVLGEDRAAVETVCELAGEIPGVRGLYAGRLRLAAHVEGLTASLIAVNRRYKTHAGVRLTAVDPSRAAPARTGA